MGSVKYTPEIIEQLKGYLEEGKTIDEMVELTNISKSSLVSKLSSMGLYKKKPYLTKMGTPSVRKSELVDQLALLMGEPPEKLESLEKCNKSVLELLIFHLT